MRAELKTSHSTLVLQVAAGDGVMPVARATLHGFAGWKVRALLGGHEEIVATAAAARQALLEDFHEVFPATPLTLATPSEQRILDAYRAHRAHAAADSLSGGQCAGCGLTCSAEAEALELLRPEMSAVVAR